MAVFDEEWQKKRATISERCMLMFNNDMLSDVSLVVREASGNSSDSKKHRHVKTCMSYFECFSVTLMLRCNLTKSDESTSFILNVD